MEPRRAGAANEVTGVVEALVDEALRLGSWSLRRRHAARDARVRRPMRLPTVLTLNEVRAVLGAMDGATQLMARLMYGAGLRLFECARLRVKDVDLTSRTPSL